jgi:threonine synthase
MFGLAAPYTMAGLAGLPGVTTAGLAGLSPVVGSSGLAGLHGPLQVYQHHVEQIVLVSDAEMQAAVEWLDKELAISVERGGAAAVAALLGNKIAVTGAAVCAVVCGRGPHLQG